MSLKVSVDQLQKQLPKLLSRTVRANDVCLIERNGQPYAVLVGIHEWERQVIGKRLDALEPSYRLSREQQKRAEALLARQQTRRLTRLEQRELNALLQDSEAVMLRRAEGLSAYRPLFAGPSAPRPREVLECVRVLPHADRLPVTISPSIIPESQGGASELSVLATRSFIRLSSAARPPSPPSFTARIPG